MLDSSFQLITSSCYRDNLNSLRLFAGQRRNVEAAKNARESTINEAPLFTNVNEVVKIDTLDDTDGSELLFVVNFRSKSNTDKKGFVVMSADKRTIQKDNQVFLPKKQEQFKPHGADDTEKHIEL